ncbi:MAG: hypothetical protein WC243_00530 [Patescibacteria group bacterium]|jgi:Ni,Fe-hydrogenase maturation factor
MKVYVFGNEDSEIDNKALLVAEKLKHTIPDLEFVPVGLNKDLPFDNKEDVVIMDIVEGLDKVQVLNSQDLNKIALSPKLTVHDFDLGFQLKYLQKIGKLGEVKILGLPMEKEPDYFLIQSILRKLVAQDMQGS